MFNVLSYLYFMPMQLAQEVHRMWVCVRPWS